MLVAKKVFQVTPNLSSLKLITNYNMNQTRTIVYNTNITHLFHNNPKHKKNEKLNQSQNQNQNENENQNKNKKENQKLNRKKIEI